MMLVQLLKSLSGSILHFSGFVNGFCLLVLCIIYVCVSSVFFICVCRQRRQSLRQTLAWRKSQGELLLN